MKNIFLFLSPMLERTISFQLEYVLNIQIGSIILLSENHYAEDSYYFFGDKHIEIFDTLQECVENSDIIIISKENLSKLVLPTDKKIIVINFDDSMPKSIGFSIPDLDYKEKPVIAILSLGEYNDQYNTEILVNKILSEKGARVLQYYSPKTKSILNSYFCNNCLNSAISMSKEKNYDIIVISINKINSYHELLHIMCDIAPDMILLCVNKSYKQEKELAKWMFGCGTVELIIRSPYISYEIVKGKTYPVFCGNNKTSRFLDSFQNDLYDVLKKAISKCVCFPKEIVIL